MLVKNRWIIVLAIVITLMIAVLLATYRVTEQRRQEAIHKLNEKAASLQPVASALKLRPSDRDRASRDPLSEPSEREEENSDTFREESIAAFARIVEKKKALQEDPIWQEALDALNKKPKEWTPEDLEKIKEYLRACGEVILELRRFAEMGGPARELDYTKGFGLELPHLAQLRDCARMLAADAITMAGDGNYAEAVADILAGMKLAHSLLNEPVLISQLAYMAIDGIMFDTIENIRGEDIPPELSETLIRYAGTTGGREGLANSIIGDGSFGLEAFDEIRNGDLRSFENLGMTGGNWNTFLVRLYGSGIVRPLLNGDEQNYADIMLRMSEAAAEPYFQSKPLLDQLSAEIGDLPYTQLLSRMLLPDMTRALEAQAINEARMDLIRLGLAVERYHGQTGNYPATLDQISSILGTEVPLDPFTGQAYVYQPGENDFVLYSAVANAIDRLPGQNRFGADENGNLVWRNH